MKGVNKIEMNLETVMEALQEYIDKRAVTADQTVTNVVSESGYGFCLTVILEEKANASH